MRYRSRGPKATAGCGGEKGRGSAWRIIIIIYTLGIKDPEGFGKN